MTSRSYVSVPRRLVIELPPGLDLLNANDRIHYKTRAKLTEKIRSEAFKVAKHSLMTFPKAKITCIFRAPDNRRRDTANMYPSFKAALDGIVDAGVIHDDNDKYVTEFILMRGENLPKSSQLIIILEEAQ
jgi:crossover junction endodeoxyribonuclease RusA